MIHITRISTTNWPVYAIGETSQTRDGSLVVESYQLLDCWPKGTEPPRIPRARHTELPWLTIVICALSPLVWVLAGYGLVSLVRGWLG